MNINDYQELEADKKRMDWLEGQATWRGDLDMVNGAEYLMTTEANLTFRAAVDQLIKDFPLPCCYLNPQAQYRESCTRCGRSLCGDCVEYYDLEVDPVENWPYCFRCLPRSEAEAVELAEAVIKELSDENE